MIFKILSFSLIGININYLLSELMSINAELLASSAVSFQHYGIMLNCQLK